MRPSEPLDVECRLLEGTVGPLAFAEVGQGPTVLLVHGAPGTVRDFRWLTPALCRWARVVVVDMPGYGTSHPTRFPPTLAGRTAYLSEILDRLDVKQCIAVGHSFGSWAVANLAQREPRRVRGVGMISPVGLSMHHGLRRFRIRKLFKLRHLPWIGDSLIELLHRGFKRSGFPGAQVHDVARVLDVLDGIDFEAYREVIAKLETPVWLTHCQDDPLIEQHIVEELADALKEREYLAFPSGGHNPQRDYAIEIAASLEHWVHTHGFFGEPVVDQEPRVTG